MIKRVDTNQRKIPEMSAGAIRAIALNILNYEMNIEAWINNNIAVRGRKFIGRKGVGDILGYSRCSGSMCICEVKTLKDKFSDAQKELLTNLHKCGGIALQATQEGLKVVVKRFISDNEITG